jgi:hypothetical protein
MPGFPIRTPWDHSLVDSSPRPIAASHVLHRLLVPRHPPFALNNLTTKMLASTVQFSTNDQPTTHRTHHTPNNRQHRTTGNTGQPVGMCTRPCLEKKQHHTAPGPTYATWNNPGLFSQDSTGCSSSSTSRTDLVVSARFTHPRRDGLGTATAGRCPCMNSASVSAT